MKKINMGKIWFAIMIILSFLFTWFLYNTNIIPIKYLVILIILLLMWLMILYFLLIFKVKKGKNKPRKSIGYGISLFLILIMSIIAYYISVTLGFFKGFEENRYMEENYLVLVLNHSNYDNINNLNNKKIGFLSNELTNISGALAKLDDKIDFEKKEYNQYDKLFEDLINGGIDSIIIEKSSFEMILETNKYNNLRTLYNVSLEINLENNETSIDLVNDTFTIYISGIDSYGKITNKSRSDVNMFVTVNPKTKQILLMSIPRDYYVQLSGTNGLKDKLTHAGIYGIDTSIKTIGNLLDEKIDYYFRVNFSSLEKIVNAVGGIDVYSKYEFTTSTNYHFSKGYNHLNGNQALAFSRERYNLPGGDITRGENQRALIDGLVRKVTSAAIITKYSSILKSLEGAFQTNMNDSEIQKLIKMQLNDMASWNISSFGLTGTSSSDYTYSYQDAKLYVMIPDDDSITTAKTLINQVYDNKILESSYDKEASNIKNPTVVVPKPKEEEAINDIESIPGDSITNEDNITFDENNNMGDDSNSSSEKPLSPPLNEIIDIE